MGLIGFVMACLVAYRGSEVDLLSQLITPVSYRDSIHSGSFKGNSGVPFKSLWVDTKQVQS